MGKWLDKVPSEDRFPVSPRKPLFHGGSEKKKSLTYLFGKTNLPTGLQTGDPGFDAEVAHFMDVFDARINTDRQPKGVGYTQFCAARLRRIFVEGKERLRTD